MGMPIALELRCVSKRFIVGTPGCNASVDALRSIDIALRPGEVAAVIGGPGAGKSTLLLCAAGLLGVDAGEISWFGDRDRGTAGRRATYYFPGGARPLSARARPSGETHLHLIDGLDALGIATIRGLRKWLDDRRAAGDTVLISARSSELSRDLVTRTVHLRAGRICADERPGVAARVAEAIEWGHL
jgi:ABC-type multidrug transport system ATPase subunit